jgi:hypothetical protein
LHHHKESKQNTEQSREKVSIERRCLSQRQYIK